MLQVIAGNFPEDLTLNTPEFNKLLFSAAIQYNRWGLVEQFLKSGFFKIDHLKVDSLQDNETSLHMAALQGSWASLDLLLSHGANINLRIESGATPLYCAAQEGKKETVENLIKRGADVNLASNDGVTPLYVASQNGHEEVVQILLSRNANVNACTNINASSLHIAAGKGHMNSVNLLLNAKANISKCDDYGNTAVHAAAKYGHTEILQRLIEHKASMEMGNNYNRTPLQILDKFNKAEKKSKVLELIKGIEANKNFVKKIEQQVARIKGSKYGTLQQKTKKIEACQKLIECVQKNLTQAIASNKEIPGWVNTYYKIISQHRKNEEEKSFPERVLGALYIFFCPGPRTQRLVDSYIPEQITNSPPPLNP